MDESIPTRYWCHMCSQVVNPIIEAEIKCPYCQDGFVEEMSGATLDTHGDDDDDDDEVELGSDRTISLWAPLLLGMTGNPRHRRRIAQLRFRDEDDDDIESQVNREMESLVQQRRRSSAAILQLLQGIRSSEGSENPNIDQDRTVLINPFNRTLIVQGSGTSSYDPSDNMNIVGSLGDYLIGPGLDILLQHLAENDPNRYGTPPAKKEAIEALPTVLIKETCQCSVCLDDLEIGAEAKEMPCKHKFHGKCILPWLDLHSSCPVCRFQLPADESKLNANGNVNGVSEMENSADVRNSNSEGDERSGGGMRFTIQWPFRSSSPTDEY